MKIRYGNMMEPLEVISNLSPKNLFLITANSTIKNNGALVMGRGAALEMKKRFPAIDGIFGNEIKQFERENKHRLYGVLIVNDYFANMTTPLGIFQVKEHFRDRADVDLIRLSALKLKQIADQYQEIHCNYPGIGAGRLTEQQVAPCIEDLPDNVFFWKFKE